DETILVVNKPAGLMVEPDRNQNPNLLDYVKRYLKSESPHQEIYAQHIHRLDRPVSGIVLFAKKREVLKNLSEQFAERRVKKYYQALTEKMPLQSSGRLEHWHRKEKKKAALYDHEIEYSEKAVLEYTVTSLSANKFLWDIELHTGKYHQIRAQLAGQGCPIIGDSLYGSVLPYQKNAIALYAHKLVFFHPASGNKMVVDARLSF
ncbi:MAG TPA: RNA pseudouridine synthase, partial [Cyclobacteriaceae bacterium]|nr:RNA pseudouridine synthase [Cyclobacteriaceae bacterium]